MMWLIFATAVNAEYLIRTGNIVVAAMLEIVSALIGLFQITSGIYERKYLESVDKIRHCRRENLPSLVDEIEKSGRELPKNLKSKWGEYQAVQIGRVGVFSPKTADIALDEFVAEANKTDKWMVFRLSASGAYAAPRSAAHQCVCTALHNRCSGGMCRHKVLVVCLFLSSYNRVGGYNRGLSLRAFVHFEIHIKVRRCLL
jgi:hypothetical protein